MPARLHHALLDPEVHLNILVVEVSNPWSMSKDGRRWWGWRQQVQEFAGRYPLGDSLGRTEALALRNRAGAKYRCK